MLSINKQSPNMLLNCVCYVCSLVDFNYNWVENTQISGLKQFSAEITTKRKLPTW